MPQARASLTREKLVRAATELVRRNGYAATSIDDVCRDAQVTKGAFFHHFKSKEELAEACLDAWDRNLAAMEAGAPFQSLADPRGKLLACLDFYISVLDDPHMFKSCLVGTTVQEVHDSSALLRDASHACFVSAGNRLKTLLDAAAKAGRKRLHTASLAALWIGTIQGSLILYKASGDASVIHDNLTHVRQYIDGLLSAPRKRGS